MRKAILVWSAQAEFDLLQLEIRMTCARRSNPAVITATSSASITKVWHPPLTWCPMVHPACFTTGLSHPNKLYVHVSSVAPAHI